MGFWDSLFRRRPPTPDDLRRRLFDAAERGDEAALGKLAEEHEALVLEHFPAWQKVPEAVRGDAQATAAYAHGLVSVAQHFAMARGRPELIQRLVGGAENPISRWQAALAESDERMEQGDFAGAAEVLRAAEEAARGLSGQAVEELLPRTLGRLGACLFQVGEADAAVEPFTEALARCRAQGDHEGVSAYLGSLYEVHRYRGAAEEAAVCLDERAGVRERGGDGAGAARDRAQAGLVRAGEPLCRVVAEVEGELLEVEDVTRVDGGVRFLFARNRKPLLPCTRAVDEGVKLGEAGDLEGALAAFRRAAELDRFDPWPSYHAGATLLLLDRAREAAESFARTEALAPGWYHCRADRWLAEQRAAGAIDRAMIERVRDLLDGAHPAERVLREARRGIEARDLGVLRLLAGDALGQLGRGAEAVEEYRRGLAVAEEPDVSTRLLTALGARLDEGLERQQLLAEAASRRGNLVAAATATVLLRVTAS